MVNILPWIFFTIRQVFLGKNGQHLCHLCHLCSCLAILSVKGIQVNASRKICPAWWLLLTPLKNDGDLVTVGMMTFHSQLFLDIYGKSFKVIHKIPWFQSPPYNSVHCFGSSWWILITGPTLWGVAMVDNPWESWACAHDHGHIRHRKGDILRIAKVL